MDSTCVDNVTDDDLKKGLEKRVKTDLDGSTLNSIEEAVQKVKMALTIPERANPVLLLS